MTAQSAGSGHMKACFRLLEYHFFAIGWGNTTLCPRNVNLMHQSSVSKTPVCNSFSMMAAGKIHITYTDIV